MMTWRMGWTNARQGQEFLRTPSQSDQLLLDKLDDSDDIIAKEMTQGFWIFDYRD